MQRSTCQPEQRTRVNLSTGITKHTNNHSEKLYSRIQVASHQDGEGNKQFRGGQEIWSDPQDGHRLEESGRTIEDTAEEITFKTLRQCSLARTGERFGRMGKTTETATTVPKKGRETPGD
ncbi:hypothetical protein M514_22796 [Trichuris suis]|uniref:Uncharacterized protein n=1 Tax=Trichuris suis TaxID=68888 RepID=A0A085N6I3_9BILA|nr:hypothetical protein M514_22796 [Trichuris suis]